MAKIFLQAEWRKLILANYEIDKNILLPHLPFKTEVETRGNTCFVSLVAFMFLHTKVKGISFPFHSNFEEVNLRFYVRYKEQNNWKRGVVFIKEIVPKSIITFVANTFYKENYIIRPMKHSWEATKEYQLVEYNWKNNKRWNSIYIKSKNQLQDIKKGSIEEYITDQSWGYTKISDNKTSEYEVEHPPWQFYETVESKVDVNFAELYGNSFTLLDETTPKAIFLAEGSAITVREGVILKE
jgi:uncharacterized protein YqjF (DUF2071 family)